MDSVIRAAVVYVVLLLIFRIAGSRTLAEITTFDFVLTLIISEAVQQAMIDNDNSITNAFLLVTTLVGLNIILSVLKQRSPKAEQLLDGTPLILFEKGQLRRAVMDKERVDEDDILEAARDHRGLADLDEIEYAVLEKNGHVSIVPRRRPRD